MTISAGVRSQDSEMLSGDEQSQPQVHGSAILLRAIVLHGAWIRRRGGI